MRISNIYVPATGHPSSKIWLIGESPGWQEEKEGKTFIGESGQLLRTVLVNNGINPDNCYFTNLCHYRPEGDNFDLLVNTKQLLDGIEEIKKTLEIYKPNVIVPLGARPLEYICGKEGISVYRGSILQCLLDQKTKCIPTYHPAAVYRRVAPYHIFSKDIARVKADSGFPELRLPDRKFIIDPPDPNQFLEAILKLDYVSCDIETIKNTAEIICVGFGLSSDMAIITPFTSKNKSFISLILESDKPRKIFHNGVFDVTVLAINGIKVMSYTDDTIIQSHVLDPELPRELAFLTSIYTREPYYKKQGRAAIPADEKSWSKKGNKEDLYIYNGKDCCVTYEIWKVLNEELRKEELYDFYKYEMECVEAAVDLSLTGLLVDVDRLNKIKEDVQMSCERDMATLFGLIGKEINVNSPKQIASLLYEELGLPKRVKDGNITSSESALVSLISYAIGRYNSVKKDQTKANWAKNIAVLKLIKRIRGKRKLISSYLNIDLHNGRAHSLIRIDGTETGRPSARKFVDGSGLNIMTIPRDAVEV